MKKMKIYHKIILPLFLSVAGLFSSCSAVDDFLTVLPSDQITGENFWEDKNDLNSVLTSCYIQLTKSDVLSRMLIWGESRSDNFLLTSGTDENLRNIMNANLLPTNSWFDWSAFYTGIAYCNMCLQNGPLVQKRDASFSENDWKPIEAELKAIRALFYFYLVRAFRDVPFVTYANDTSEGAKDSNPQVSSQKILSFLIEDLEAVKDNGMINYGSADQNKSRFTRNGIYALLCDIYLWRAAKNSSADSLAKYPGQAESDYKKVIEYADFLSQSLIEDFKKDHTTYYGGERSIYKGVTPFPLYCVTKNKRVTDMPFIYIFGEGFSLESLFEIATHSSKNPTYTNYFGYTTNFKNMDKPGAFSAANGFQTITSKPDDASAVYSKTDLRYYENIEWTKGATSTTAVYNIMKHACKRVQTDGADDITNANTSISYESWWGSDCEASYIQYRISDVLLMKAEAIACLQQYILKTEDPVQLKEGYDIVKAVFDRSNPMITDAEDLTFDSYNSSQALEEFVMRERRRELFAEGKRWFDLLRYAMRQGSTTKMLNLLVSKYSSNASAIKAKLATMNSLFNPVYTEEMKVNTALVQNPAWVTDETIVKN